MKKLPIGIQTLEEIITENYVYVDKTKQALDLIENGKYYFLSRPRRFGKSLFIDTLKNIFQAKKELFEGLYIYDKYDWEKSYPVININFAKGTLKSKEDLDDKWDELLRENESSLGLNCDTKLYDRRCFSTLIKKAYEKYNQKVVVLIDEYDKPILDNVTNLEVANLMREGLRDFYSVIKGSDEYMQFAFLTGVTKFAKSSIFSGLNNIQDITLHPKYATLCGYTQVDVETVFIKHLQDVNLKKLKQWYNGYNFTGDKVYNPFDILLFISQGHLYKNYWFETGTPTFLIEIIKKNNYFLPKLSNLEVGEELISSFDIENLKVETLLFQAGYLTIDKVEELPFGGFNYHLTIPNLEVKISLNNILVKYLTDNISNDNKIHIYNALASGNLEQFKETLTALFASIPYNNYVNNTIPSYEGYYASVIYAYLASLGLDIVGEDVTNLGRIDLTIKLNDYVYILEFKVNESFKGSGFRVKDGENTNSALEQIKQKNYHQKYLSFSVSQSLSLFLIGIEFDEKKKNISNFSWEKIV